MMKLRDVLLNAMAKKITWSEAAQIIGVTDRTMRRWREAGKERPTRLRILQGESPCAVNYL
jgi:DNA-binding Xre family transcriptional regulator